MVYTFAAGRQLIFYVKVGGRTRLVQFGERNNFGGSQFLTQDENIANAIRQTSMFKRGVIMEATVKPKEENITPKHSLTPNPSPKGEGSIKTELGGARYEVRKEPAKNVLEVDNFTQAKEALSKKLGIDKKNMKTPAQLSKIAKENGIAIKYTER